MKSILNVKTRYAAIIFFAASTVFVTSGYASAQTKPLSINLNGPAPLIITGHLGLGTTAAPDGKILGADSRCIYRNGQPWIPVMGEYHYSRYPQEEWRDELLKMKAGGINVIATYVFWIHHEEEQGKFDWSGRRCLRDFLSLCRELDLMAMVRMGPWSHGEARNGGFPDWVVQLAKQKGFKPRTANPEFMALVAPLYQQIALQTRGLLWKDGGPVIGIQLDNECRDLNYLMALKQLARDNGIDVPFYTMTGWNRVPIPKEGLLPLFGAYADGFWSSKKLSFRKSFFFSPIRDDGDMGAVDGRIGNIRPERNDRIERFPYVCCEIGGGMPSSYENRIFVTPEDTAAIALVRLGDGNNMPGYYMYHGGINPEGKLTTLNETRATGYPNDMPIKDYDFGAPIGACGQIRDQYYLLRQQHLFLKEFGEKLALMPAFFPEAQPLNFEDVTTVRWTVRSDGQSGFLFFNNHQRYLPLPAKENVRFTLRIRDGVMQIPRDPVTLPAGSFGFWPFNMDCGGIHLEYATVQPLCQLNAEGQTWFFFTAIEGITPEFMIRKTEDQEKIYTRPGTDIAFTRTASDGRRVNFVVLTPQQGKQFWKLPTNGQERVALCGDALLQDTDNQIRIESLGSSHVELALFPQCSVQSGDGKMLNGTPDGIFRRFQVADDTADPIQIICKEKKTAVVSGDKPADAMNEEAWNDAAVWQVQIPEDIRKQNNLLRIRYTGDVARVYAGGRLIMDHFYNGQPLDVALWRLTPQQQNELEIRIMPLRSNSPVNLTADVHPDFTKKAVYAEIKKTELIERKRWTLNLTGSKPKSQ